MKQNTYFDLMFGKLTFWKDNEDDAWNKKFTKHWDTTLAVSHTLRYHTHKTHSQTHMNRNAIRRLKSADWGWVMGNKKLLYWICCFSADTPPLCPWSWAKQCCCWAAAAADSVCCSEVESWTALQLRYQKLTTFENIIFQPLSCRAAKV